jgi:flagellar protein FlaF
MSPYGKHTQNYERIPEPGSPRKTEGWALIEAAKRMAAAIVEGPVEDRAANEMRKSALRLNWKLWTIFQAELTLENLEMDQEIRLNMLTLCKFVDKHTVGALLEPKDSALSTLIDLNRNIALGLLNMPSEEEGGEEDGNQSTPNSQPPNNDDQPPPPTERVEIKV